MPRIPQATGPEVRTAPLPAPMQRMGMATPDAFGASIAQGLERGGMAAIRGTQIRADAEAKAQQERDDFEVLDADNQLVDASNDLRASALQVQGKNAQGLSERTRADFDKMVEERAKALTTPAAQQMFRQRAAQRWNNLDASVVSHSENEITKYKTATLQGAIEREGMEAAQSMDPARIADAERKMFVARQGLSDIQGVDLEVEHAKDASNLYSQATERLIAAKNWDGAAAFYEANKGKILPHVRDKVIEPALREGMVQGAAELATRQITMPRDGAIPTRTQAMSAANKIEDPEVKKRTMESIKALYVEREQSHESDQQESYNALHRVLRENGGNVNALDPVAVSQLDAKWWKTLESDAKSFAGETTPTKQTYDNLAATDHIRLIIDQGKISSVESMRQGLVYGNYESETEFPLTESSVRVLAANNGLTAEQTKSVTDYMKQGGIKGALKMTQVERAYEYSTGGRKYDDDRKKYPALFDQVRERLPPGAELTDDAVIKAMAPLLAEGEITGGMVYDTDTTYGQAASQGKGDEWMPNVDAPTEKAIASFLKENVRVANVTPEVVRKFHKYEVLKYPTPLRDGRPMTPREAVLAGTIQGNARDLPPAAVQRGSRASPAPVSAYDDSGSVRFTSED